MIDAGFQPRLDFAFELRAVVADPIRIGAPGDDDLHFAAILGGEVQGPLLNGRIVPGGGDWWRTKGSPQTTYLDARYLLQASDGAMIEVVNRGCFWLADETYLPQYEAREPIPEEALYYRTAPVFTTDASEHLWLTRHQFVGLARPDEDRVHIRVYRLR